jgi:hypothetical protein
LADRGLRKADAELTAERGCPGTARNAQLRNDIIPAVASGNIEDDVNEQQNAYLEEIWQATSKGVKTQELSVLQRHVNFLGNLVIAKTDELSDQIENLEERIETGDIDYERLAALVVTKILTNLDVDLVPRQS